MELPKVGEKFKTEQKFGVIESVKSVSDLFMPIAGEITAINDNLNSEPELVNLDTYKGGWMIKVKIENASEVASLMSAEDYKKFIVD